MRVMTQLRAVQAATDSENHNLVSPESRIPASPLIWVTGFMAEMAWTFWMVAGGTTGCMATRTS